MSEIPAGDSTPVTIFGRTYSLRGGGDPDYLARLAKEVDGRMREVAEATGTADTLKVAILAALNIADDNLRARTASPSAWDEAAVGRMTRLLDEILDETGGRSEAGDAGRAE
jgi:cell division protein ZapA